LLPTRDIDRETSGIHVYRVIGDIVSSGDLKISEALIKLKQCKGIFVRKGDSDALSTRLSSRLLSFSDDTFFYFSISILEEKGREIKRKRATR